MQRSSLLLCLALAACATETPYRAPEAGQPAAKVRFKAIGERYALLVTLFGNAQCEKDASSGVMGVVGGTPGGTFVPARIKESGNTLGMAGHDAKLAGRAIERLIRADRPFVFAVQRLAHGDTATTCSLSMSFTPRPDAQYEVEYGEDEASCYASVYRLQGDGAKPVRVREPSAASTPKECSG